jgi:alpha/beta superfamily hydrolase
LRTFDRELVPVSFTGVSKLQVTLIIVWRCFLRHSHDLAVGGMMLRATFGLVAIVFAHAAAAQSPSMKQLDALRSLVSKPQAISSYGAAPLQVGELRLPRGRGPFPVGIVVHGGCWHSKVEDRTGIAPIADALTKRGIATWTISYRRIGDAGGGWPGTFEDVAAATDHLRRLAKSHPLDLSRVSVIGHSAGAHLALWIASRSKLSPEVAGKDPLKIAAVYAIDGPGALAPFLPVDKEVCGMPVIEQLMGGLPAAKAEAYRLASPADHLPLGVETHLIMADLTPFMEPYRDAATAKGERVSVLSPEGADHFNVVTPGTVVGNSVIDYIVSKAPAKR